MTGWRSLERSGRAAETPLLRAQIAELEAEFAAAAVDTLALPSE